MNRFAASLLIVALACVTACCQDRTHEAGLGQLVVLETDQEKSTWTILEPTDLAYRMIREPGRSLLLFSSGCKPQRIVAICVSVDANGFPQLVRHVVAVGGDAPTPDPDPPTPPPAPVVPDVYGVGLEAYTEASKVADPERRLTCKALAVLFRQAAVVIGRPPEGEEVADTVNRATEQIKPKVRSACSHAEKAWEPFFVSLQAQFRGQWTAGRIRDHEQHRAAFREVADALEMVR